METRTKYIGVGTTILTIGLLLGWFANSNNFDVEVSGDISCTDTCVSYFNITSKFYTYYLYNKEGVKLGFTPEIKEYAICKPDKRCKSCGGCPAGWREIDFTSPYTSRYKYVYKFYRGKKETFMLIGKKEPFETIKWGLEAINKEIDPIWYGINITKLCEWKTIQEDVFDYVDYETTYIHYDNETHKEIEKTTINTKYEKIGEIDVQVCDKKVGYKINNKILNFSEGNIYCNIDEKTGLGECDMCPGEDGVTDGNCDGILQSGESGFPFDAKDPEWHKLKIKVDSPEYKKLKEYSVSDVIKNE